LSAGDGSSGIQLTGVPPAGISVGGSLDFNGDGFDDVIVARAHFFFAGGASEDAEETYLVFGHRPAAPGDFDLATLETVNGGTGEQGVALISSGVSHGVGAGDVNGDGVDDLIIGAPYAAVGAREYAGETYVVFGRNTAQAGDFPAVFSLARLFPDAGGDGSEGFVLGGIADTDRSGWSVAGPGDVNGDGVDDVMLGAINTPDLPFYAGETYVVFGRDTARDGRFPPVIPLATLLAANGGDGSAGFVLRGIRGFDEAGFSVSGAGDVNADGLDDLIIGSIEVAGSYLVFGRDTSQAGNFPAEFPLANLLPQNGGDGSEGFTVEGIEPGDSAGRAVSGAGDVNGDGIDDLIIGARYADSGDRINAGASYLVFGRDTAQTGNFPAVFPLSRLLPGAGGDGSQGVIVMGINPNDKCGTSVSAAGDVNGDGTGDVVIGAYRAEREGQTNDNGEAYVVFGRPAADGARR